MKLTVERGGGPWRFPRDSVTQTSLPHDKGSKGAEAITSFRSSCVLKEELVVQPGQRQPRKCGLRDYQILVCKPDPFSGLRYSVTQTVFRGAMTKLGCPGDEGASRDRSMLGSRPHIHPLQVELTKYVHVKLLQPVAGERDRFYATAFSSTLSLDPHSSEIPILYELPSSQFKVKEIGCTCIDVQIFQEARLACARLSQQMGSPSFRQVLASMTGKIVPDPASAQREAWNKRIFGRIPVPNEAFHRDDFPWNNHGRANMKALVCVMAKMLQVDMKEPIITEKGAYRFCAGSSWSTMVAHAPKVLHEVRPSGSGSALAGNHLSWPHPSGHPLSASFVGSKACQDIHAIIYYHMLSYAIHGYPLALSSVCEIIEHSLRYVFRSLGMASPCRLLRTSGTFPRASTAT
jgi:hypothetical protein